MSGKRLAQSVNSTEGVYLMKRLRLYLCTTILVGSCDVSVTFASTPNHSTLNLTLSARAAEKLQDSDVNELVRTAFDLYRQKKYDEALANCTKAAEIAPSDFRPPYIAGIVYMEQGNLKSASESFAKSISLKPDNKRIYLLKARADLYRGAKEEAIATCNQALKLDPSFAEAYAMIGDTLKFDDKRRSEAIAAYQAALKANPKLLAVYEQLGDIFLAAKDEKGAEELFRKAMAADPKSMLGRFPLGRLLVKQGRLKEAREVWAGRTSDEDRTFPEFITVLERAEKLNQATDALAQNPNDPDTLLQMGLAEMDGDSWVVNKRQERAIVYFRKALTLKPEFALAQYNIVKAYIQLADVFKNQNKNVDEELEKLRQLEPKLAKEMEEYRKTYSGGLKVAPLKPNQ